MSVTKVIREPLDGVSRWELPDVEAPAHASQRDGNKAGISLEELEALQKQAYDEGFIEGRKAGFEQGLQEGRQAGEQQARELAQRIRGVFDTLSQPLQELDEAVEEQLLAMVMQLAQQLVRRELQTQPGEVLGVVREAVGLLPVGSRDVQIYLHPEDAAFLRDAWSDKEEAATWRLVEDPSLSRGGCQVVTPISRVDATVEQRLAQLTRDFLGGSREDDQ